MNSLYKEPPQKQVYIFIMRSYHVSLSCAAIMRRYHANAVSYHASGAAARSLDEAHLRRKMKNELRS